MKKPIVVIILMISVVFLCGCVDNTVTNNTTNNTIACTEEAKLCPDGSYVSRDSNNNCEFSACPEMPAQNNTETQQQTSLIVNGFDYYKIMPDQAAINTLLTSNKLYSVPLLYTYPVAVMPMTYYFSIDSTLDQVTINNMEKQIGYAFQYWENAAKGKLKFEKSDTSSDIIITLVNNHDDEKLTYTDLGDAKSSIIARDGYTIITGGTITSEIFKSAYPARTVMMHQIGHLLGFSHSASQTSIMSESYLPGGDLQQKINTDTIKVMEILYKDTPVF
jgi:hypothetical protein